MTDSEKLKEVLHRLKQWTLPDEKTDPSNYWDEVSVRGDNSTDHICDMDIAYKDLIKLIEAP